MKALQACSFAHAYGSKGVVAVHEDHLVGKLFREGKTKWAPGSFFTMIGSKCTLDIFWDNISREDVWRFSNGKVSFGVWYSDDKDLFFLYRLRAA